MAALTEETAIQLLQELKKLNSAGLLKKQKPDWKNATQITRLTVWDNADKLRYARGHDLVRFEVERNSESKREKTKEKCVYRYDYNSVAPEYRTTYQPRKTA